MKKFYLSLAGLILCGSVMSQNASVVRINNGQKAIDVKSPRTQFPPSSIASGSGTFYVEPIGDIMFYKGLVVDGSASANQDWFLDVIYQDSTVKLSSPTSTRHVADCLLGSILDPTSTYLDSTTLPLFASTDPYVLDSIFVLGSYVKVTPDVDTLYVWVVWGEPANASVFTKSKTSAIWLAPISGWRDTIIGPRVNGATASPGNKMMATAPASNQVLVKYALQGTDSSSAGHSKYMPIGLPTPINVPAGNIVSCFYTFIPGGATGVDSCCYSFTGAPTAQNVNGFGGIVWNQTNPAVNALADYVDQQVDPSSWCMGADYDKGQRHAAYTPLFETTMWGDLVSAPVIIYKISGNSTSGIAEAKTGGNALGQNVPNPFSKSSTIHYELKNSSQVTFVITDMMGRVVKQISEGNKPAGNNQIVLNSSELSKGIYFYTLKADGVSLTKKMIVMQ